MSHPHFAPEEFAGRIAQVRDVAERIALVRGISVEELAAQTMATAHEFYKMA